MCRKPRGRPGGSCGERHGAYKFPPKLDFARIREIAATVDVPLVLHGGSGLTDLDFKTAIREGISKVNIFTDINVAAAKAVSERYTDAGKGLTDLIPSAVEAVRRNPKRKCAYSTVSAKDESRILLCNRGICLIYKISPSFYQ